MCAILLVLVVLLIPVAPAFADESTQVDWSGGPEDSAQTAAFTSNFVQSNGISWLAVPGQIALSSEPLDSPVKHVIASEYPGAYGLYVIDFEGDGDADVIATTDTSNKVIIWFNGGDDPITWTENIVDDFYRGGTSVHPADIDGDGDLDLVAAAQTPGNNITWWRNEGGDPLSWSRFKIERSLLVACNLFVADIDGDGDLDVASTSWASDSISWWRNEGQEEDWPRVTIDENLPDAHSAFAFDPDGDGDLDIVGTSAGSGQVVLYMNELGNGTSWSPQVIGTGMAGVRYATAADIDCDGRPDLAAAAFNGQIVWWRNEGGSPVSWSRHAVDNTCLGGHYLSVGDLNGDGFNDLVTATTALDSLIWYIQDPSNPDDWDRIEIDDTFDSPLTGFPFDIDGDGDLDVVGTSPVHGEIAWWEISRYVNNGTLESSVLDLGENLGFHGIRWTQAEQTYGSMTISIRSGNDPEELGPWSPEIRRPAIVLEPWSRFLQYRVSMSSDGSRSPILLDVTAHWNGPSDDGTTVLLPRIERE